MTTSNSNEKRAKARQTLVGVPATVLESNGRRIEALIVDLTEAGLYLRGLLRDGHKTVKVKVAGGREVRLEFDVVHVDRAGSGGKIQPPLSAEDMADIRAADVLAPRMEFQSPLLMAQRDEDHVRKEIRAIQMCRSSIFLATLGAMGAAVIAIKGFAAQSVPRGIQQALSVAVDDVSTTSRALSAATQAHSAQAVDAASQAHTTAIASLATALGKVASVQTTPGVTAILFGIAMTLGLFLVGVLSTIEKARAVNIRKGFLKALSEYMSSGTLPRTYAGWSRLNDAILDCGVRRKVGGCPHGRGPDDTNTCWHESIEDAAKLNTSAKFFPGMFTSFMSLSSFVYSVIFLIIAAEVGYYLSEKLKVSWQTDAVWVGVAFGGAMILTQFFPKWKREVIGGAVVLAVLSPWGWKLCPSVAWGYILAGVSGALLGVVGKYLLWQTNQCRRGKYSIQTYYYAWRRVIANCKVQVDDPRNLTVIEDKGSNKFFAWLRDSVMEK